VSNRFNSCPRRLILAGFVFLAGGCVTLDAPPDPTRYYLLNGESDPDALMTNPIASAPVVRLAPVELDPYLDTPYMVLRRQKYEVQFSDIHRWGEDLASNIRRALARDLLATGGVSDVVFAPSDHADYVVEIHVHRFEGVPPDIAHMSATWRLLRPSGRVLHETLHDDRSRGWQFENYAHLAEKLDESLNGLAGVIVTSLKSR
jgi:uncharacterized lipoprotein YmbA